MGGLAEARRQLLDDTRVLSALGLRKVDVDLVNRLLTVGRSYERDTTKGGHADVIPIAAELIPFLEEAISRSPSELVFPRADGTMESEKVQLEQVLRRALRRAGVVTSYRHVCRRKGCGHKEMANEAELRRCPKCNMKLWPSPQVRPLRFHHLRHSTASLLMMPEDDSEAVVAISEEDFARLLGACAEFREVAPLLREVTEFTAETGLRRGEVFTLTFRSVDLGRNCIRVEMQRRVRLVNGQPWKPKNSKWREIPLSTRARAIIDQRRADGPCGPDHFVFPNQGGAPYVRMDHAPECAGKGFFPDAVEAAGLKGTMTFHGLRHLFAVRLLTRGVPITVVSDLLGHSDINLTVKRYGRFASEAKVKWEAMKVLDPRLDPDRIPE